jgi:hypothetical protein
MSDEHFGRYEKQEKEEEKQTQAEEKEEKNWDEKWRRDPLSATVWATILIWAGTVLLVGNLGLLRGFEWMEAWPIVLIGAGGILLVEAAIRFLVPTYRRPITGTLILGLILVGAGLGDLFDTNLVWPLILIAFGLSILLRGVVKRD